MRRGIQLLTILLCLQVARIVRNAGTHRGHVNLFLPVPRTPSSASMYL
jgi:hypothetical protein